MSKFDIMRAVVDGKMKMTTRQVLLELNTTSPVVQKIKPKVWALGSIKIKPLKVANRTDWFGKFELKTGQV